MIDPQSRNREADVGMRLWTQGIHRTVSAINRRLQKDEKYMALLKRVRAAFVRNNETGMIKLIDEKTIPSQRKMSDIAIEEGQSMIAMLRDNETKSSPASMYKTRGHWITSLISSGAMSAWESTLYDSSQEELFHFKKKELNERGEQDGLIMTEWQLKKQFVDGIHTKPDDPPPLWSTASLRYPETFVLSIETPTKDSISDRDYDGAGTKPSQHVLPISPISMMPMSILAQTTTAERTILRNGEMSVKVVLTNNHTNGTVVKKEIKDDACGVLEEAITALTSMAEMRVAIGYLAWEQRYALQEDAARAAEDDLD